MIKVKLKDGEIGHVKEEDFEAFRKEYLREDEDKPDFKELMSDLSSQIAAGNGEPIKKIIVKAVKRNSLGLIQGCELEVMR